MTSEVGAKADFSRVRYGQCWEDADVLLAGLDVQPGDTCLSIASAGDNALALLSRAPGRVVAVDLSFAQLSCLALRVAAYRVLSHEELLELVGSRPSRRRLELYARCRHLLAQDVRAFWDQRPHDVAEGIANTGKFERFFALFRSRVLPLVHSRESVRRLLRGGTPEERERFYNGLWNSLRWRLLFRVFFSRFVVGRLGRDPSFFQYVRGSVADRFLARSRHALTALDPADNPYLQWILTGRHTSALPFALRPENFAAIRANLDRLEMHWGPLEGYLAAQQDGTFDRFNLSDVFEYISPENYHHLLRELVRCGRPGGRLAYWNLLVTRRRPREMASHLRPLDELAERLHLQDKAFFYSAFVVEEIQAC
jgi:S-adenosylmethionine-diacylglycerol 3-amino-3-carboxypropyl transferase